MSTNGKRKRPGVTARPRQQPVKLRPSSRLDRFKMPPHLTRRVAYVIIGISVLLSWFVTPLPIAIGMTILAAVRLWIVFREERQEKAALSSEKSACTTN